MYTIFSISLNIKPIVIQCVVQYRICPGLSICSADNLIEVLNKHLSLMFGRMYQLRSSVCSTRVSLGLMINADVLFVSSSRLIVGGSVIALGLTGKSFRCQVRDNETYSVAKGQISVRNRDVLMNTKSPDTWLSTLKSAVYGSSSSLSPLVSEGGGQVCESVGKAGLLSDHFDSMQSRETVDLPHT